MLLLLFMLIYSLLILYITYLALFKKLLILFFAYFIKCFIIYTFLAF